MDRLIEKKRGFQWRKHGLYAVGALLLLAVVGWAVFGNHAATLRVSADDLTMSDVERAEFKDYVRTNGRVMPIQVVQISPEEGGIVMEKVVEEGAAVKKGDVIIRLSNSARSTSLTVRSSAEMRSVGAWLPKTAQPTTVSNSSAPPA